MNCAGVRLLGAVALLCAAVGLAPAGVTAQPPPFTLMSPAFADGDAMPTTYTCDGSDFSPALVMADLPPGTAVLALTVVDIDAGGYVHWIFWDLPTSATSLGTDADIPGLGGIEGVNDFGQQGYGGPCPPCNDDHLYRFTAYALQTPLALPSGSDMATMMAAMSGNILAEDNWEGTFLRCAVVTSPPPPPPPPPPQVEPGVDTDQDGIQDTADNCQSLSNFNQADLDGDARGDVCDDDIDGDGLKDAEDDCPAVFDPEQKDSDVDGTGDACQTPREPGAPAPTVADADGDLIPDASDNCAALPNNDQNDLDRDRLGDMCDVDADGDGILDSGLEPRFVDNCQTRPNHDQKDSDDDGSGDVCDATPMPPACVTCTSTAAPVGAGSDPSTPFPWELLGGGLLLGALVGLIAAAVILGKPRAK